MANKKTKRELFGELREVVLDNAELVAFIDHELELLDKKASKSGTSKTQKENAEIIENIYNELANVGKAVTITELQKESEYVGQFSNQKVSALIKKLVDAQRVVKTTDKKKSYFAIAE